MPSVSGNSRLGLRGSGVRGWVDRVLAWGQNNPHIDSTIRFRINLWAHLGLGNPVGSRASNSERFVSTNVSDEDDAVGAALESNHF